MIETDPCQSKMKRIGNLYEQVYDLDNLRLADKNASKGKSGQLGVIIHNRNRENDIQKLHVSLKEMTYKTSEYSYFKIFEPKQRDIATLPYFPDRVCQHAILNIIGPILTRSLIATTYSCIVGRGIHRAYYDVKKALQDVKGAKYVLKVDIKKYFQNVSNDILKSLLRRKFKDQKLLWLLDEIIDSERGLPIGSYLSSCFANFYLNYFDHWMKEEKKVKFFRYCDDILVPHHDKQFLHNLREDMQIYLWDNLRLEIKNNYQVYPVAVRGIDFVGYKSFHYHSLLRKSIKQSFKRMIRTNRNKQSIASYNGWISHCNGINLMNRYLDYDGK